MGAKRLPDNDVVRGALDDDPKWSRECREELLRRYGALVWDAVNRAAWPFGASEDDRSDANLEAWVRILEKLPMYRSGRGKLTGFLWIIAYRATITFLRRVEVRDVEEEGSSQLAAPESDRELMMDIADCIALLEDGPADVITKWSQGYTGKEIGEPLGLDAVQAFKRLIWPALDMLRRCLAGKGYDFSNVVIGTDPRRQPGRSGPPMRMREEA